MDLLATVRKEGSRGGQGDFKWSDVQASSRRENYLGHSLMAPVGRWQKGRDLNWYAKGDKTDDGEDPAEKAERERKEEIKRVKEAEEDALARALGLPVADRNNANQEPVSDKRAVDKAMNETVGSDDPHAKGLGYGARIDARNNTVDRETIEGNAEQQDKELQYALKEYKRRQNQDGSRRHRSRSRSRDRKHHRSHRDRRHSREDRSRDERPRRRSPSRSRSPNRRRDRRHRDRSKSPRRSRNEDIRRRKDRS